MQSNMDQRRYHAKKKIIREFFENRMMTRIKTRSIKYHARMLRVLKMKYETHTQDLLPMHKISLTWIISCMLWPGDFPATWYWAIFSLCISCTVYSIHDHHLVAPKCSAMHDLLIFITIADGPLAVMRGCTLLMASVLCFYRSAALKVALHSA